MYQFRLNSRSVSVPWIRCERAHLHDGAGHATTEIEDFFSKLLQVEPGETEPPNTAFQ